MIIYLITNTINSKQYVGQTKKSFNGRWRQHCDVKRKSALSLAISKYGKDNFKYEILFQSDCQDTINSAEIAYIKQYNTRSPNGYNIHEGGNTHTWTDEVKAKFSESRKGVNNPRYGFRGPTHTPESKEKLRQLGLGRTPVNAVKVICIELNKIYNSMYEAAKELGVRPNKISLVCSGKRKSTGGYTFKKAA